MTRHWQEWQTALEKVMPRGWRADREARSPLARWAQPDEIETDAWRWREGDASILLGRHGAGLVGRRDDDRHVITVAGSRAGKGRSLILPNLAQWPGSVICIDPKGELARKTASWRAVGLGQHVVVLDPFGVSGCKGGSYNPLDDVDRNAPTFMDDVALVADALIIDDEKSRHWTDSAKNLVRALTLFMLAADGEASLPRLRRLLLGYEGRLSIPPSGAVADDYLFLRMAACRTFDGHVAVLGRSFLDKTDKELDSIVSVAREQLAFLDSVPMSNALASSSFRLHSVKRQPTTVYMCLPAGRLATHARWLRVIVNLALAALEEDHVTPRPVLLLLEEFAVLGHLKSIENAAGQIAGFGVKLWAILQDLGQLRPFTANGGKPSWVMPESRRGSGSTT